MIKFTIIDADYGRSELLRASYGKYRAQVLYDRNLRMEQTQQLIRMIQEKVREDMATADYGGLQSNGIWMDEATDYSGYIATTSSTSGGTVNITDGYNYFKDLIDDRLEEKQQEGVADRLRQELASMKYEKKQEDVRVNRLGDECFWAKRNATKFEQPLDELRLKVHNWLNPN